MPSDAAILPVIMLAAAAAAMEAIVPQPRGGLLFPSFAPALMGHLLGGTPAATLICAFGVAGGRALAGRHRAILPDVLRAVAGLQAAGLAYGVAAGGARPWDAGGWAALGLYSAAFLLTLLAVRALWHRFRGVKAAPAPGRQHLAPPLGFEVAGHLVLAAHGLLAGLLYVQRGALGAMAPAVSLFALAYLLRAQVVLQARNSELSVLHDLSSRLACSLRLEAVFQAFAQAVHELLQPGVVALFLARQPGELHLAAAQGVSPREVDGDAWMQVLRRLAAQGDKLLIPDLARHLAARGPLPYRAFLVAPLRSDEGLIGAVAAGHPAAGGFHRGDLSTLVLLAEPLARAVRNAILYEETESQAITDPITGLYNYRYFRARLREELRLARAQGTRVAILYLDLDRFKEYNDSLGHQAGDEILVQFASLLRQSVRQSDIPARYGGDEFVVILPRTAREEAADVAHRVHAAVCGRSFGVSGTAVRARLSFSYGISCFPDDAEDEDELIYVADRAMYRHKRTEEGGG